MSITILLTLNDVQSMLLTFVGKLNSKLNTKLLFVHFNCRLLNELKKLTMKSKVFLFWFSELMFSPIELRKFKFNLITSNLFSSLIFFKLLRTVLL